MKVTQEDLVAQALELLWNDTNLKQIKNFNPSENIIRLKKKDLKSYTVKILSSASLGQTKKKKKI